MHTLVNAPMPRKGKRRTIATGISQDSGGYEVRGGGGGAPYASRRMPKDSTRDELRRKRAQLEAHGHTTTPRAERGTLAADALRYLKLIKYLESAGLLNRLRASSGKPSFAQECERRSATPKDWAKSADLACQALRALTPASGVQ